MVTRRTLLANALMTGAGMPLAALHAPWAQAQGPTEVSPGQGERNKAVVRRFKEAQGTADEAATMRAVLAPNYRRWRGGLEHLAANARDQGFPGPGAYLRGALPDRTDEIVDLAAEGDQVAMLFRVRATHKGNLFGIAPTGKALDFYEVGFFTLAKEQITEAWFMADEAGLLLQLGATLPPRKDGQLLVPPVTGAGEEPDAVIARLQAAPPSSPEDRNRLIVARSKGAAPPTERAGDFRPARVGFQHLRDYGNAKGVGNQTITSALPDRRDRIDGFVAEGEKVWMRFKVAGTHTDNLYGLPPTGKRVEVPEVAIIRIVDGRWTEAWYFADELGLLLQLGAVQMLLG
jgi:predicted ester cyclase